MVVVAVKINLCGNVMAPHESDQLHLSRERRGIPVRKRSSPSRCTDRRRMLMRTSKTEKEEHGRGEGWWDKARCWYRGRKVMRNLGRGGGCVIILPIIINHTAKCAKCCLRKAAIQGSVEIQKFISTPVNDFSDKKPQKQVLISYFTQKQNPLKSIHHTDGLLLIPYFTLPIPPSYP